jgi:hypothetical protein
MQSESRQPREDGQWFVARFSRPVGALAFESADAAPFDARWIWQPAPRGLRLDGPARFGFRVLDFLQFSILRLRICRA